MRKVAANLAIAEETAHITRTSAYLTMASAMQYLSTVSCAYLDLFRQTRKLIYLEQGESMREARDIIRGAMHELAEEIRNV